MADIKLEIPSDFLKKETRNDYIISEEMKRVWAIDLDLFKELERVCKENNLKLWGSGGTAIGAARHKGFIPWDDDIDVQMLRKDFDKLCEIAPQAFSAPYFFQTESTDPLSLRGHAQFRNSNTTALLKSEIGVDLPYNRGIFIDIFPLDNVPDDEVSLEKFQKKISRYNNLLSKFRNLTMFYEPQRGFRWFIVDVAHFVFTPFRKPLLQSIYFKREKIFKKYLDADCSRVGELFWPKIRCLTSKSNYNETIYLPFEFIHIPIPAGYDEILTVLYGDWKKPVKAPAMHGGLMFDTETPYTEFKVKT